MADAAKSKGTTQYAMDCLNGGAIQHGLKFPCGWSLQPPKPVSTENGWGARPLPFFGFAVRPIHPLDDGMAVIFIFFWAHPSLYCSYNLYSYSYVHTLYICVAFEVRQKHPFNGSPRATLPSRTITVS